ncbi:hypothetical protein [Modestobacter roseus]|uniref:hypothetical protein n=1 Tax=Modestobacter roseus TaxID=1181884 RepID=UPI0012949804|nr:hypothetical protein [Modestobacter roseus]MQA35291.1 hypothetical protein [Modestobacter roseus]
MTSPTPTPAAPPTPTDPLPSLVPPAATTTSTITPAPAPATNDAPAASGGGLTGAVLSAAVVAAIVGGSITTALARRATRLEERSRVRTTLAEAYQAYGDYKEFPYAIRRRRPNQDGDERIRLSEELRQVQSRLSFYQAWTRAEDPTTGTAYNDLVSQLRRVAGTSMREAWLEPALANDAGMNIGPDRVDLSELKAAEEAFLKAAEDHVKAITEPWWRRVARAVHQRRSVQPTPRTGGGCTASAEPSSGQDAADR